MPDTLFVLEVFLNAMVAQTGSSDRTPIGRDIPPRGVAQLLPRHNEYPQLKSLAQTSWHSTPPYFDDHAGALNAIGRNPPIYVSESPCSPFSLAIVSFPISITNSSSTHCPSGHQPRRAFRYHTMRGWKKSSILNMNTRRAQFQICAREMSSEKKSSSNVAPCSVVVPAALRRSTTL